MSDVQTYLREAWAAAERQRAIEAAAMAEQIRSLRAEAARDAAEAQRLRRNAASKKNGETGASIGAVIGGVALGLGGCVSCASQWVPFENYSISSFNLITGLLIGVIGGAVIGALIGATAGQSVE